ncbi:hypothetical protein BurMR1_1810 [Burkholderia sp. MR1]|nr:hypothetical protein BurMR1_1810 [Burkholderia sp. MR1]
MNSTIKRIGVVLTTLLLLLCCDLGWSQQTKSSSAPAVEQKVYVDNERVRVAELTFKPGAESANMARPFRVSRAIKGGRYVRIYADGRREEGQYETGEVKVLEASSPYVLKNVGDDDLILFLVYIKK